MSIELVPLCTVEIILADAILVGEGPAGLRIIFEVESAVAAGDRLNGRLHGKASADWATVSGTVANIDVRSTMQTDDGAIVFLEYTGRTDISGGPGSAPIYVAPRFETGDERYAWLNAVQAVGKGVLDGSTLVYEFHEAR